MSLAVWIGGVIAEVDLLRRIRLVDVGDVTVALLPYSGTTPPSDPVVARVEGYARLLDAAGYDRVEVDLLAGASAGGLNGVVYAVAQRAGMSVDGLLRTWSTVGGFWGLLNEPGAPDLRALMRGEGYFRSRVRTALSDLHLARDAHPDLVADHVSVDLSTTVIDGQDEAERDASEGRGHFRFVGNDTHHLDNLVPSRHALDYPGKLADDREQLWQLALAARSTSSLAGGFEPAEIRSTEWPGRADAGADGDPAAGHPAPAEAASVAGRADLRFAFAAHRAAGSGRDHPYRVIDGAVFDNVPIDRALRAAKLRPSERRADRALLFLDPEPDPPLGGEAPWDPDASRFAHAVGEMFRRGMRTESVAVEAAELGRFNGQRFTESARAHSAAAIAAAAATTPEALDARRRAYVRAQAGVVAEQLADALAAPSLWQLQSASRRRRRYAPVDRIALGRLVERAARRFGERAVADVPSAELADLRSPIALGDAANCLLGWCRALEAVPDAPGSRRGLDLTGVREAAYAALVDAGGSRDALVELVLLDRLRTLGPREDPDADRLDAWLETWLANSDLIDTSAHWRALDAAVAALRSATDAAEGRLRADEALPAEWTTSPWRKAGPAAGTAAVDLPPLLNGGGIPPALSHVTYWAIGVDEEPANPHAYEALLDDRFHTRLQGVLRTPRLPVADAAALLEAPERVPMDRETKLAGYGFGNFFGFLAAEWRVNDWWWGRLDGAAGLTRFLARDLTDEAVADAVRAAQDAVLAQGAELAASQDARERAQAPFGDPPGGEASRVDPEANAGAEDVATTEPATGWPGETPSPADPLRGRMQGGTDTLWNLDPEYRFALASRALRLLDRVARPANRVVSTVLEVVLAVLRPLLVVLPAVADPPRLALIAGVIGGTLWLLTWTGFAPSMGAAIVATAVVLLFAAGLAVGTLRSRRRWEAVAAAIGDARLAGRVRAAARAAVRPTTRYVVVAVATFVPLWIAVARSNLVMVAACGLASLVMTAVAVRAASAARPSTVKARVRRTRLMLAAFVLLGGVLPLVQWVLAPTADGAGWPAELLAPPLAWDLPVLAVASVAVSIALTWEWLPLRWQPKPLPTRGPARFGRATTLRSRGVDWLTVATLAAAVPLALATVVVLLMAHVPDLHAVGTGIAVFVVAWGNAVWWLPEFRRRELPRIERVDRRPPQPVR
ncbi:DUF3376 domain-containing protein [Agromyces sp. MMS24-K17]|uniref:DUF3376 domain-containing protein n=1 Tax=Agromyces sp. MMS24-K17 TaxID=3372850 RepID=UPI0037549900